jgi:predicted DNA-binding ribbon-helix-helix protein
MKSLVVKRSVVIDGQKSSVSLEDAFWTSLKDIAHERRETLQHLITSINVNRRRNANLSSAIRLFILKFYKDQARQQKQRRPQGEF